MKPTNLVLVSSVAVLIFGSMSIAQEYCQRVESGTDRVQLCSTVSGPRMLVAMRRNVDLDTPIRHHRSVGQIFFRDMPLPWAAEDAKTITQDLAETHDFENWSILPSGLERYVLVASDMEGISPLELPNNPMARLWLVPITFGQETLNFGKIETATAIQKFRKMQAGSKITYVVLDEKSLFTKVESIVAIGNGNDAGVCVGLAPGKAIWAKDFTLAPLAWAKGGGVLEGSYDEVSVAFAGKGLLVVGRSGASTVDCFWAQSATSLSKAKRQRLVSEKNRKPNAQIRGVTLTASGGMCVLGLLMETQQNTVTVEAKEKEHQSYQLEIYACSTDGRAWKTGKTIPLAGRVADLSLLIDGNKLLYAYLSTNDETKGVSLHTGRLSHDAWKLED